MRKILTVVVTLAALGLAIAALVVALGSSPARSAPSPALAPTNPQAWTVTMCFSTGCYHPNMQGEMP